jgi:hypothetical protein
MIRTRRSCSPMTSLTSPSLRVAKEKILRARRGHAARNVAARRRLRHLATTALVERKNLAYTPKLCDLKREAEQLHNESNIRRYRACQKKMLRPRTERSYAEPDVSHTTAPSEKRKCHIHTEVTRPNMLEQSSRTNAFEISSSPHTATNKYIELHAKVTRPEILKRSGMLSLTSHFPLRPPPPPKRKHCTHTKAPRPETRRQHSLTTSPKSHHRTTSKHKRFRARQSYATRNVASEAATHRV